MPVCKDCKEEKDINLFSKNNTYKSGYSSTCKACHAKKTREYRRTEKGRKAHLESLKKYQKTEAYKKSRKKYEMSEQGREKRREHAEQHRQRHPEKKKCREITYCAIKKGDLIRKPCEKCGNKKVQAHHDDYSKPMDVRWLCVKCHNEHHRIERNRA